MAELAEVPGYTWLGDKQKSWPSELVAELAEEPNLTKFLSWEQAKLVLHHPRHLR